MPARGRSSSKSDGKGFVVDDGEQRTNIAGTSTRARSSSRLASRKVVVDESTGSENESDQEDGSLSNAEESEMEETEHDFEEKNIRQLRKNGKSQVKASHGTNLDFETTRRSARSTKFSSSMAEPSNSVKEFLIVPKQSTVPSKPKPTAASKDLEDTDESEESQYEEEIEIRRPQAKSKDEKFKKTASTKTTREKTKPVKKTKQILESSDDEEYDDDDEPMKIQKIIASRTETKRNWLDICHKMNTTEILGGSRWHQDPDVNKNETKSDGTVDKKKDEENDIEMENQEASSKKDSIIIDDNDVFEERFLVRWSGMSFLHCSWETQDDLVNLIDSGQNHLRTFFKKNINGLLYSADERCDGDYFDPAFTQIERLMEIMPPDNRQSSKVKILTTPEEEEKFNETSFGMIHDATHPEFETSTGRRFYIKWCNMPYSESTIDSERDLILHDIEYKSHLIAFLKRNKKPNKLERARFTIKGAKEYALLENLLKAGNSEEINKFKNILQERIYKNGGQLRDYQAEGVAWMISNFINGRSSILCDEMGLGKTLQTAATCDFLINKLGRPAPILIVAPLSTLAHWYREFCRWTDLNAIIYHGTLEDRLILREFEFAYEVDRPKTGLHHNSLYLKKCLTPKAPKNEIPWMVNVVITTPEMLVTPDHSELAAIKWGALVVDEAHRMKNINSKLGINLRKDIFQFDHKILLTGTPIQNDVKEFWTILNFIDPNQFSDVNAFMEKYGDMKSKELVDELHDEIRPFILRRLKEDVEKSVPPKEETVIEVELTIAQKQYYRALYEKNLKFLHKNKKKTLDGPSLNNLAMQLRKVCNHLFLLNGIEKEFRSQIRKESLSEGEIYAKGSGKLVLLDKLLPRLKEEGHRVLVFSQFKIMLDILEDYFHARSMKFERIDGSITGRRRQQAIDRFQSPDSNSFIMMLTTRAGGVGINLTAADTCIIFDSDWNPQNDLQAQARCHRIGQTKSVKVYRLLSRKTYEMQMFQMSSLKMGLEQAVLNGVEGGSSSETALSKEEVERLLRHGAYDIFSEDKSGSAEAESNDFVQLDIDSILERRTRTVIHDNTGSNSGAAGGTFSKASFKLSRPSVDGNGVNSNTDDIDIEDPDFWKKMIGEPTDDPTDDPLMLTTRRERKQINSYSERDYQKQLTSMIGDSEEDAEDDDEYEDEVDLGSNQERSKWGGSLQEDWTKEDAESLAKALWTFGYGVRPWEDFKILVSKESSHEIAKIKHMSWSIIFATIKETADDEAEALTRKRDQSSTDHARNKLADGLTATAIDTGIAIKEMKEKTLRSVVRSLGRWFGFVLNDAVEKAKGSQPRGKDVVSKLINLSSHDEQKDPSSIFATNVWPSLKSRGWKVTIPTEGNQAGKSIYSFKDREFLSTDAVLSEVLTFHPELRNAVESILAQTRESRQQTHAVAEKERENELSLTAETITYETLEMFFYRYAPLQLIIDRTKKTRRIRLSRKILSSCNMILTASSLMSKVLLEQNSKPKNANEELVELLANALVLDKRWLLPHPSWTVRHDAILIQAIDKHGWVDNDSSFLTITDKTLTKWGWPFDAVQIRKPVVELSQLEKDNFRAACDRAAKFLNEEQTLMTEMRGFNHHTVIRAFGLVKNLYVSNQWYADPSAAPTTDLNDAAPTDVSRAQLPSKKDMTKRAKTILCNGTLVFDSRKTVANFDSTFTQVDQNNKCNLLLVELLRALLRESAGSKASYKICALASAEAKIRYEEMASLIKDKPTAESKDMTNDTEKKLVDYRNVLDHLELVKRNLNKSVRLYKNVLRVMLGEEPQKGKNSEEDLFPNEKLFAPLIANQSKENDSKWLKTTAVVTIDKARKRLLTNFSSRDGMKNNASLLHLTEIETLILSALCKLGVPIWSKDWKKSFAASTASLSPSEVASWHYLGYFVMKVANMHYKKSSERLEVVTNDFKKVQRSEQISSTDVSNSKATASSNLRKAQHLYEEKKEVFRQATDYQANSDHLAKKSILLLAKIQTDMASASVVPGLDPKMFAWLESEIRRWATSLDLLADNGQPLAFTAIDFLEDLPLNERETIKVFSSFDKHSSRAVMEQTAMMTRLRSIFSQYSGHGSRLREKIVAAVNDVKVSGVAWEVQPVGWEEYKDVVLLHRLARNGFTDTLLGSKENFGEQGAFAEFPYTSGSIFLTFGGIQARASQLVRELHAAEERPQKSTSRVLEDRLNQNIIGPELDIRKAATINLHSESGDSLTLREQDVVSLEKHSSDFVVGDKKRGSSESGLDPSEDDVVESPEKKNRSM